MISAGYISNASLRGAALAVVVVVVVGVTGAIAP
jgi:hypothetical protein